MSDFGKEVAETFRSIKDDFEKSMGPDMPRRKLDKSIAEQVGADLDGLIKKHEGEK